MTTPLGSLPLATPRTARDPVCGMDVDVAHPAATSQHDGQTVYFCSANCKRRFDAEPGRFAGGKVEAMGLGEPVAAEKADYTPLIVVIGLIALVTAALTYRDYDRDALALERTLAYFMAGFFLVFAGFKLLDLRGFADAYDTYDLLAKRVPAYGYLYPFLELGFGIGMLLAPTSRHLLVAELAVMAFSGLGVAIKLAKHETFRCACLGTVLKVPLTKVTLVEDFGVAALALAMLLL